MNEGIEAIKNLMFDKIDRQKRLEFLINRESESEKSKIIWRHTLDSFNIDIEVLKKQLNVLEALERNEELNNKNK